MVQLFNRFEFYATVMILGVGVLGAESEWLRQFPTQPSFIIVRKVQPEMDRWMRHATVYGDWIYRGKFVGLFRFGEEANSSDWRLIHRNEEDNFRRCELPFTMHRLPAQIPYLPLLCNQFQEYTKETFHQFQSISLPSPNSHDAFSNSTQGNMQLRQIKMHSVSLYSADMRRELLASDDATLCLRDVGRTGLQPGDRNADTNLLISHHNKIQEKLADDFLQLTRSLKENIIFADDVKIIALLIWVSAMIFNKRFAALLCCLLLLPICSTFCICDDENLVASCQGKLETGKLLLCQFENLRIIESADCFVPSYIRKGATVEFVDSKCKDPVSLPDSPLLECFGKADGNYAAGDCDPFYFVCSGGHAERLSCPEPQRYDAELKQCSAKAHIPSCADAVVSRPPKLALSPPSSALSLPSSALSPPSSAMPPPSSAMSPPSSALSPPSSAVPPPSSAISPPSENQPIIAAANEASNNGSLNLGLMIGLVVLVALLSACLCGACLLMLSLRSETKKRLQQNAALINNKGRRLVGVDRSKFIEVINAGTDPITDAEFNA